MCAISIISTITGGYFYLKVIQKQISTAKKHEIHDHMDSITTLFANQIRSAQRELSVLAEMKPVQVFLGSNDPEKIQAVNHILDSFQQKLGLDVCYLLDKNGLTVASSNRDEISSFVGKNYGFRSYFKDAMKGRISAYMAVGVTSKIPGFYLGAPVYDQNGLIAGVAVLKQTNTQINRLISNFNQGIVLICDHNSLIFMSNQPEWLYKLMWKQSDEILDEIKNSRQLAEIEPEWSGLVRQSENDVADKDGNIFKMFNVPVDELPGWEIFFLVRHKGMNEFFWDQSVREVYATVITVCVVLSLFTLLLYHVITKELEKRKAVELELNRMSIAIEQSPVSVVITDKQGDIQYVNQKFSQVTGYACAEAVGKNPRILNAGVQPASFYENLWTTISSGRSWQGEFCNKKKNGELYWERASISPVMIKEEITNYVAVKEDITLEKSMFEEIKAARMAAESANQAKSEFLANMSHEMRTPLNGILGMADLALDLASSDKQRRYLSMIQTSGSSLLDLINGLLDISKIESGKYELESIVFSLGKSQKFTF